jgi:hypothetical protein
MEAAERRTGSALMQHLKQSRMAVTISRLAIVTIAALMHVTPGLAQRCNPAVDGTHCATLPPVKLDLSIPPPTEFGRMQSLGNDLAPSRDQPGTLGAITFRRDGTQCIGLLRRSNCN